MSKLLKLDPNFRVVLPTGAVGGTGTLEWSDSYADGKKVTGGTLPIKVSIPDQSAPQDAVVKTLDDKDVTFQGAVLGGPQPPYLTLRVYPQFAEALSLYGSGDPIVRTGRPHEFPAGSGCWDFQDLGGDNRPVVVDRAQLTSGLSLSGTQAQRRAYNRASLTSKTRWDITESPYQTYWYTPGDTSWRDSSGNDPDAAAPPADDGRL